MLKYFVFACMIFVLINCKQSNRKIKFTQGTERIDLSNFFSEIISDSFAIFVNLPNGYDRNQTDRYPVVFLLDANLYFDIISTAMNKYSEVGLAPSVILVGIGYKDFATMDSLRNRDDTYPIAIPEYEMSVSGGADKFLSFIDQELIPYIDNKYNSDTLRRLLMGHSLAGYFTCYALLQHLSGKSESITGFIAASPSLHYNHYYLLDGIEKTQQTLRKKKIKAYVTYGGLEDTENTGDSSMRSITEVSKVFKSLLAKQSGELVFKTDIFSNLGHMETQIPTFMKGLHWALNENK